MKKIRIALIALFAAVTATSATAQEVDECLAQISYYKEYYKQGTKAAKKEALPSWRKAYSICQPGTKSMRQSLYLDGASLYRMLIVENKDNAQYKDALFDTLVTLHKLRAQYYPASADKAYAALAKDVNNYCKQNPQKTYELMNEIMTKQHENSDPATFLGVIQAAVALYKEGKLSADDVISDYEQASQFFNALMKVDTTQNTRNLHTTFENSFINSNVASADNLVQLFRPRFQEHPEDFELVDKMVRLLARVEGGSDTELFMEAATKMHTLKPSGTSAYALFRLNISRQNVAEALRYGEEACDATDVDEDDRARNNYEFAVFCMKNNCFAQAVEHATRAKEIDSGTYAGKAYFVIGQAWMSAPCTGNEVESRAKFWVAVDNFGRAKTSDPFLTDDANKQINQCVSYFPATAEAFMYDLQNGQSYSVSCGGMYATTTVRTR